MKILLPCGLCLGVMLLLNSALVAQDPASLPGPVSAQSQMGAPSAAGTSSRSNQQDSTASPEMTGQEMKDKIFLRKAVEGCLAEVRMGQLAATKGSSEDIRNFAAKMATDHTRLIDELRNVADTMGFRLPKEMNKMDQGEYDKLKSLSGEDFDREYVTVMMRDHRKNLHDFRAESTSTQDTSLKELLDQAEPLIREHTRTIGRIAKEKGIAVSAASRAVPPA